MKPLRIGNLQLATNLLLAPIAGYCDLAFRLIVRSFGGVGLACTDLLSPEGILRGTATSLVLAKTSENDSPLCMQLYGADATRLIEAAKWCQDQGAAVIDLNMGCPVDKVTKKDGGSKLLCNPDATLRLIEKLAAAITQVPFTCKMRLGWDDSSIVAPYLAKRLEQLGVKAITIHGRTTEMRFSGQARLDGIAEVVASVQSIPVIGNGDVKTPHDAKRMLDVTGCAGVMIGRAALSRPWIIRDMWSYLTGGEIPAEPTVEQKVTMIREHFWNMVKFRSERSAVQEMRKRISWYGKSIAHCGQLKEEMRQLSSAEEFTQIMDRFLDRRLSIFRECPIETAPESQPQELTV